jgi:hypothetical protein
VAALFIGTEDGLHELSDDGARTTHVAGHDVTAIARHGITWWAVIGGDALWRSDAPGSWDRVAVVSDRRLNCVAATDSGLLIGTSEAHLLRLANGTLESVDGFEKVEGRDGWYTPWGGPPDSRSIAAHPAGPVYVNVHVGGIVRTRDGGQSWEPTIEVDSDVHQVIAVEGRSGTVLAATARGLAESGDGGDSWTFFTEGLHAEYCRAVAVAGGTVLVSSSEGPRGRRAAIYRRALGGKGSFAKCEQGLPDWFGDNIDTACLAAGGSTVAFGTEEGAVFVSEDEGQTWKEVAGGLPPVRCLAVA